MELSDTRIVSLTSNLFRGFVFVAAITENSDSHKQDVGNGSKFLMLLWQGQGILARPSSKTLAECLYEKYISFQCTQQLVLLSYR